jgi:hypothetical protein
VPDDRPKPNKLYYYCAGCDRLCNVHEAGSEDGERAWRLSCTRKLWAEHDAPRSADFLSDSVRRCYDPLDQVTHLSTRRAATALGVEVQAVRKVITERPVR